MKTLILLFKPILLVVISTFFVCNVHAQSRIDVVQLKNGNVLKGTIVRQIPGKFLEIKTLDKNFWKFDMEDIAEIRYEKSRIPKFKQDSVVIKDKGILIDTRAGIILGSNSNENEAPFSLLCSVDYLFKNGLALGGGFGLEAFKDTQIPLFGDIRYHHKIRGLNTYLFCLSGYSFPIEDRDRGYYYNYGDEMDAKGGWLINPGVGVILNSRSNTRFSFSLGYRYQKNKVKWNNTYTDDTEYLREEFNRLSIHFGIIF
jgi:hypothetical protein